MLRSTMVKIFITSLDNSENGKKSHEIKLREIYKKSDQKHGLVDNAIEADIILVGNVDDENGEKILRNQIIQQFPEKCFSISNYDTTLFLNHGIYTSTSNRSFIGWKRVRTGSYTLLSDNNKNPYISNSYNLGSTEKKYLFSFIGRDCHAVRKQILNLDFERKDILIEDSSKAFDRWKTNDDEDIKQYHFFEVLSQSKFSLCPRGAIYNSIRLFESLQLGVAPVIIADGFLLPKGPNWKDFSIFIKERHVENLESIVQKYEDNYIEMGLLAKQCFEDFFSDESYFNYIVDNCIDIQNTQIIPEEWYWKLRHLYLSYLKLKKSISKH